MLKELMGLLSSAGLGGASQSMDPRLQILNKMGAQPQAVPMLQGQARQQAMQGPPGGGGMPPGSQPSQGMPPSGGQPGGGDEAMLAQIAQMMGGGQPPQGGQPQGPVGGQNGPVDDQDAPDGDEGDDYEWQGQKGVPTPQDLKMLDDRPTDGMIASFIQAFPQWSDQNNIAEGGQGHAASKGDYALGEEDYNDMYKGRSTKADER